MIRIEAPDLIAILVFHLVDNNSDDRVVEALDQMQQISVEISS